MNQDMEKQGFKITFVTQTIAQRPTGTYASASLPPKNINFLRSGSN